VRPRAGDTRGGSEAMIMTARYRLGIEIQTGKSPAFPLIADSGLNGSVGRAGMST
jgi:hypothetical protein